MPEITGGLGVNSTTALDTTPRGPAPSALRHGKPVGNDPHPRRLRKRGRDLPIDSLKAIRTLAERVRLDFRGEVF